MSVEALGYEPDDLFDITPELTQLADFSLSRMTSRWGVLGCCLARLIAATDHNLALPAVIGSHASLNLGVAIVGSSGTGKGASERVAADALDLDAARFACLPFGSGEGVSKSFVRVKDGETEFHTRNVLFSASEVSSIGAIGARQGSTLYAQLCSLIMGERLGFKNADDSRSLIVPPMSYRAAAIIGVQPGRSAALVENADMGIPQRFVWLPALDPAITGEHVDGKPLAVHRSALTSNVLSIVGESAPVTVELPDVAVQTVRQNRLAQVRGETDTLDGHALLTRLKVAAAMSILHGRKSVDIIDWEMSGLVMQKSEETRAYCIQELEKGRAQKSIDRERVNAVARSRGQEAAERDALARVKQNILRHLEKKGGRCGGAELRRKIAQRDRFIFEDALEDLIEDDRIIKFETAHSLHYELL